MLACGSRPVARRTCACAGVAALASLALCASMARADDKRDCIEAYEQAQSLEVSGKLRGARELFITCARSVCPAMLQSDCTASLQRVATNQPTVVIAARDAHGRDTAEVRLTVDGELVSERVAGSALAVDPGEHVFRYEASDGRVLEQHVIIHQGEKNRIVPVVFSEAPPPPHVSPAAAVRSEPPAPAAAAGSRDSENLSPLVYGIGALGVVAMTSFAFFGLSGKSKQHELETQCAPNCSNDDMDVMYNRYLVADVSLGIGISALATAATWVIVHQVRRSRDVPRRAALPYARGLSF